MVKVEFIGETITNKGHFRKGDSEMFSKDEAKALQRLSTVKSPAPTVKKEKPSKKVEKDESKDNS
jgi:hypothetical protein